MLKNLSILLFAVLFVTPCVAQQNNTARMHAHNDYIHPVPFWEAFANGFESIEVDLFLQGNTLCVAHEEKSISTGRTFETLYLQSIQQAFSAVHGKRRNLQLLVDIKTESYTTLAQVVKVLDSYKDIMKTKDREGVVVVISGNRPVPADFMKYPEYVQFDYQSLDVTKDVPWEKVAMVSLDFHKLSSWNGLGRLIDADKLALEKAIAKVHSLHRPIRFWATPDISTAWRAMLEMGVDFINTDSLFEASTFVRQLPAHTFTPGVSSSVYKPSFRVDGKDKKIKNVVLVIGDGMGLAQISAGLTGNGNVLTLAELKNIGLSKTQSADDYTTDSAAGGTALATGNKTKNRYIGVAADATRLENLPEYLSRFHFNTGVVTTDHVTGATPASFYSHQLDRGMTQAIAADLAKSPFDLFIGGGAVDFSDQTMQALETSGFTLVKELSQVSTAKAAKIGFFAVSGDLPSRQVRGNYLTQSVDAALAFLSNKKQPFFLMVEGAKIDSGGHANAIGTIVDEMIDLDQALASVLRFADANDETLVIITADHETGGLSLPQGNMTKRQVEGQFQSTDHSGILVPVFAYGPHADEFTGVYENTTICKTIMSILKKYY